MTGSLEGIRVRLAYEALRRSMRLVRGRKAVKVRSFVPLVSLQALYEAAWRRGR